MKHNFLKRAQAYLSEKKEETQQWRQDQVEDDSTAAIVWRRYSKQIMIGIVLVTVLALGLIIFLPKGHEEVNTGIPSFQVTKEDKTILERQTREFVSLSGKWGIDSSKVTDDNVREVAYLVSTRAKGYQNFTISRTAAYEQVKGMVYPKSSVDFSESTLRTWERESSVVDNYLPSFDVSNIRVSVPQESRYISINGQNVERVGVDITYDSVETIRVMRGTDVASDGSFGIFEKTFKNNKATIYFVRDSEGKWKVHSMEGDNKFLLVPFGVADYESYYFTQLEDFEDTGLSLRPKIATGQEKKEEPKKEEKPETKESPDTKETPAASPAASASPEASAQPTQQSSAPAPRFTVTPSKTPSATASASPRK